MHVPNITDDANLKPFTLPEAVKKRRITFLGSPMDAITLAETIALIETAIRERHLLQHVVVNVAKLVTMQTDTALSDDVAGSDLINIDGMGVVWGARLMGHAVPERVTGIDVMDHTLALCAQKGFRPFILGAKEDILKRAVTTIEAKYPGIMFAGAQHGYYPRESEQELMASIRDSGADCLFIAMPSPHKERILNTYKHMLGIPFLMGVGGSVDVFAGLVTRAPEWMQKAGLEWFYRFYQEPRRMWKRYLITNSRYAWLLVKARVKR